MNGKYVVFKAEDIDRKEPVPDAVVIRRQDLFAGPALDAYASSISISAKVLRSLGAKLEASELQKVADYFAEQAVLAHEEGYKLPD